MESGDKLTRFGPFSSQCRAGNVKIRRGFWNEELFRVLEGFPDLAHNDEVDACIGALEMLNPNMKGGNIHEVYRRDFEQRQAEEGVPAPAPLSRSAGAAGSTTVLAVTRNWKFESTSLRAESQANHRFLSDRKKLLSDCPQSVVATPMPMPETAAYCLTDNGPNGRALFQARVVRRCR